MERSKAVTSQKYFIFLQRIYALRNKPKNSISELAAEAKLSRSIGTFLRMMGLVDTDGKWISEKVPTLEMADGVLAEIGRYHKASKARKSKDKKVKEIGGHKETTYKYLAALFELREAYKNENAKPITEMVKELKLPSGFNRAMINLGLLSTNGHSHKWDASELPNLDMVRDIKEWLNTERSGKYKNTSDTVSHKILNELIQMNAKFDELLRVWG